MKLHGLEELDDLVRRLAETDKRQLLQPEDLKDCSVADLRELVESAPILSHGDNTVTISDLIKLRAFVNENKGGQTIDKEREFLQSLPEGAWKKGEKDS